MLKRHQVLLSDWQEDYIKFLSKTYDVSTSEAIRVQLCVAILAVVPLLFPEYKSNFKIEDILKATKKWAKGEMENDDQHRTLSKIYFEARKAVEFRLSKENKQKRSNTSFAYD